MPSIELKYYFSTVVYGTSYNSMVLTRVLLRRSSSMYACTQGREVNSKRTIHVGAMSSGFTTENRPDNIPDDDRSNIS